MRRPDPLEVAAFWALRARRIASKKSLEKLPADTAFVAISVEPNASRRSPTRIHVAVLPKLRRLRRIPYGKQSLGDFVRNHGVEVFSYKLETIARNLTKKSPQGQTEINDVADRVRRALHIGFVKTRHRDAALTYIVDQLRALHPGRKLVVVGYSLQDELGPMGLNVLDVLRRFDNWFDLADMAEYFPKHLVDPYHILRDQSGDHGLGEAHAKAESAIKHLSILHGLLHPRQKKHDKMQVAADVDRFSSEPYQAMIYAAPPYTLPPSIDSARKIAEAFDKYEPIGVGADDIPMTISTSPDSPAPSTSTIDTPFMNRGCLCFEDKERLRSFVKAAENLVIDGRRICILQKAMPDKPPEEEKWEDFGGDMTLDFRRSYLCTYRDVIRELDENDDWD
ncbi:hypothetical protein F5Y05DRAFT_419621 [Hypoxylon sp. FL0543]|nr:hypothetical protein F5Y05DRAFT_419621 [Hypoxylon sp. FL0543]